MSDFKTQRELILFLLNGGVVTTEAGNRVYFAETGAYPFRIDLPNEPNAGVGAWVWHKWQSMKKEQGQG